MKQKELTELLIKASEAYYNGGDAIMTDLEFDRKVEELRAMEKESGTVYPGSPTQSVGAKADGLKKVKHEQPALSLDKIKYKDRAELAKWLGDREGVVSWKMDGLTVVLTYDGGRLVRAVTRGDGYEGSDITHNAMFFTGVPRAIAYKGRLTVRGEAVMSYAEFERINSLEGGKYENPRNLAAATVQMLDSSESRKRKIEFFAFELAEPGTGLLLTKVDNGYGSDTFSSTDDEAKADFNLKFQSHRMMFLGSLGFGTVCIGTGVTADIAEEVIGRWEEDLQAYPYPTDGLVFTYDDLEYGYGLGMTGHHPKHSIALKWTDETAETTITGIEWSVGKTGVITPVAVFEPVRLGAGSTITRASLHNLSIMRNMPSVGSCLSKEPVRIGSRAWIYLANMIIPQVAKIQNTFDGGMTCPTEYIPVPATCPVCGAATVIRTNNGVQTLHCTGNNCRAKVTASLMNTFSKDGLFVRGLGESQIEDLMDYGIVDSTPVSFYRMTAAFSDGKEYSDRVASLLVKDGWGKKKWENLVDAVNASRNTTLQKFLYSLNIPMVGNDLSKKLAKYYGSPVHVREAFSYAASHRDELIAELMLIEGVGEEKARSFAEWCRETGTDPEKYRAVTGLMDELIFPEAPERGQEGTGALEGLTFVITGTVHEYKNRDEFKASVEARGGKVAGSVSAKTSFLVNNDVTSMSGKNQKAKELGIPVISENEFIARFGK